MVKEKNVGRKKLIDITTYIDELTCLYQANADLENARQMAQYMRNQFAFFGINAQQRRKIAAHLMTKNRRPGQEQIEKVIRLLWQLPQREYQYFAMELVERYKRLYHPSMIYLFESMLTQKSWWDTVDLIAKKLVGEYFLLFPDKRDFFIQKWLQSQNIWLQRSTLLFQLGYKKSTDSHLLFDLIIRLKEIDAFFIQKAIGWSLREYSKSNPDQVMQFIKKHDLSALSRKEGMKYLRKLDHYDT